MTEAIRLCNELRFEVRTDPVCVAVTLHPLAALHAMLGEFEQARSLIREGNAILTEAGRMQSAVSHHEALVEMLADDPGGRRHAQGRRSGVRLDFAQAGACVRVRWIRPLAPAAEDEAAEGEAESEGAGGEAADRDSLAPGGEALPAAERLGLLGREQLAAALLAQRAAGADAEVQIVEDLVRRTRSSCRSL